MSKSSNKKDLAKATALKQGAVLVLGILLLAGASWLAMRYWVSQPESIAPPASLAFFYDTHSGSLFTAPATRNLPISTPGATEGAPPTGVLAMVFSCTSCADEKTRQPYLLETRDPNDLKGVGTVVAAITKPKTPVAELTWIPSNAPAAIEMDQAGLKGRCPGNTKPILCQP